MKRFIAAAAAAFLFIAAPALAATYSAAIDDLPLMDGMKEKTDGIVVMDSSAGRIVDTVAETGATRMQIYQYYVINLPPLGWALEKTDAAVYQQGKRYSFIRKGERLEVDFTQGVNSLNQVSFHLTPAPAATTKDAK